MEPRGALRVVFGLGPIQIESYDHAGNRRNRSDARRRSQRDNHALQGRDSVKAQEQNARGHRKADDQRHDKNHKVRISPGGV